MTRRRIGYLNNHYGDRHRSQGHCNAGHKDNATLQLSFTIPPDYAGFSITASLPIWKHFSLEAISPGGMATE